MDPMSLEIQQKRLEKELAMLKDTEEGIQAESMQTHFGYCIEATISHARIQSEDVNADIVYQIFVEGKFPFQAPKILVKTSFTNPSISDGRDLLPTILKTQWNPSITMIDLINNLPKFTDDCIALVGANEIFDLGIFHLGHPMAYAVWDDKPNMAKFACIEIDSVNPKTSYERIVIVTQLVIIQLDRCESPDHGVLISWATLQSLSNIKRSRLEADRLTFEWKDMGENPSYVQYFKMAEANQCIELISHNLKTLEQIVNSRQSSAIRINEEEVSAGSVRKTNIEEVMVAVDRLEREVRNKVTIDGVGQLMQAYQQGIEYYGAIGDERFDQLLKRMHATLQNEEISAALSPPPAQPPAAAFSIEPEEDEEIQVAQPEEPAASNLPVQQEEPDPSKFSIEIDDEEEEEIQISEDVQPAQQEEPEAAKFSIEVDEDEEIEVLEDNQPPEVVEIEKTNEESSEDPEVTPSAETEKQDEIIAETAPEETKVEEAETPVEQQEATPEETEVEESVEQPEAPATQEPEETKEESKTDEAENAEESAPAEASADTSSPENEVPPESSEAVIEEKSPEESQDAEEVTKEDN